MDKDSKDGLSPLASEKDLSRAWLERMLSHSLSAPVSITSWSGSSPEKRSGVCSEISFVRVIFGVSGGAVEEERHLVMKFMPQSEKYVNYMKGNNLAEREVSFYKYVGTERFKAFCEAAGVCDTSVHPVPHVYWADSNDRNVTIVLRDLNKDNYRQTVPPEGNSLIQIKSALRALAVIHAFGYTTIKSVGYHVIESALDMSHIHEYLLGGLNSLIELYDGTSTAATMKALCPLVEELFREGEKHLFIDSLVHGDTWTGNILFSEDDHSASIIDWQYTSVDNPVRDVVCLLLVSGEPSVYCDHLTEVLECYWRSFEQALLKNGVSIDVSFEDMLTNFEDLLVSGFTYVTGSLAFMIPSDDITQERIRAVMSFFEKKGVFEKFLRNYQ